MTRRAFAAPALDRQTLNVLVSIREAMDANEDAWPLIVQAGQAARRGIDGWRWIIGDLALLVETHYGQQSIADFAKAVDMNVHTVENYRTIAGFWPADLRGRYLAHQRITWSHMREAARLPSLSCARRFIMDCVRYRWSSTRAQSIVGKRSVRTADSLPPRIYDLRIAVDHEWRAMSPRSYRKPFRGWRPKVQLPKIPARGNSAKRTKPPTKLPEKWKTPGGHMRKVTFEGVLKAIPERGGITFGIAGFDLLKPNTLYHIVICEAPELNQ